MRSLKRRCTVIAVLLASCVSVAGALGSAGAPGSHCATPNGYRVAAKTGKAVVLVKRRGHSGYGCVFGVGRHFGVADSPFYKLSGPYVAYSSESVDVTGARSVLLVVRDLRDGRFRHVAPAYKDRAYRGSEARGTVTDITLEHHGSVAWIPASHALAASLSVSAVARISPMRSRALLPTAASGSTRELTSDSTLSSAATPESPDATPGAPGRQTLH
jgi:hypothetical protein